MTERLPLPAPDPNRQATWDPEPLAAALEATIAPTQDLALGQGFRLSLPDQPTHVDLFPAGRAAQVVVSDARMMLIVADQEPPYIAGAGVVFERPDRSLTVGANGEILLVHIPGSVRDAASAAETARIAASEGDSQDSPVAPASDDLVTSQTPTDTESETTESIPAPESDRVRLLGRLGAAPRFRTTRNEVLIGTFPLAVREDDDTTTWHTVRTFRERAAKLQDAGLTKGQLAEVIGYRHTREQQTRAGEPKLVEEIYAVVVKPRP